MARSTKICLDDILERYVQLLVYRREVGGRLPADLDGELAQLRSIVHRIEISAVVDCDGDGVPDAGAMFRIDHATGKTCCRLIRDDGAVVDVPIDVPSAAPVVPPAVPPKGGSRAW